MAEMPALAGGDEIDGKKPAAEPGLGLLEDGAGQERVLLAAGHAFVDDLGLQRVSIVMATGDAAETIRPACREEVLAALLIGAESGQERWHVFRQVIRDHRCLTSYCV